MLLCSETSEQQPCRGASILGWSFLDVKMHCALVSSLCDSVAVVEKVAAFWRPLVWRFHCSAPRMIPVIEYS